MTILTDNEDYKRVDTTNLKHLHIERHPTATEAFMAGDTIYVPAPRETGPGLLEGWYLDLLHDFEYGHINPGDLADLFRRSGRHTLPETVSWFDGTEGTNHFHLFAPTPWPTGPLHVAAPTKAEAYARLEELRAAVHRIHNPQPKDDRPF